MRKELAAGVERLLKAAERRRAQRTPNLPLVQAVEQYLLAHNFRPIFGTGRLWLAQAIADFGTRRKFSTTALARFYVLENDKGITDLIRISADDAGAGPEYVRIYVKSHAGKYCTAEYRTDLKQWLIGASSAGTSMLRDMVGNITIAPELYSHLKSRTFHRPHRLRREPF